MRKVKGLNEPDVAMLAGDRRMRRIGGGLVMVVIVAVAGGVGVDLVGSVFTTDTASSVARSVAQAAGDQDYDQLDIPPAFGPPPPVPSEIKERLTALRAYKDRVRDAQKPRPARVHLPEPPRPDSVPPRMDSGHPDPDRLLPSSRPEIPEFVGEATR